MFEYKFDVKEVTEGCVKWIVDWFEGNGKDCNAIIGISGGKDSTIVAKLCVEALGVDRVIGVLMPNGEQKDISDAQEVVKLLGIKSFTIGINEAVNGVINSIPFDLSKQSLTNLPPRIRMSTLYAVAQSCNGRVANTCNLSENWVGYSTIFGDAAGSFSPLGCLTVTEVKAIGHYLGLPDNLVDKIPSDGLCGKSDEDNLGFTYEVLDKYIRTYKCGDEKTKKLIDSKHKQNLFKLKMMPEYEPFDDNDNGEGMKCIR